MYGFIPVILLFIIYYSAIFYGFCIHIITRNVMISQDMPCNFSVIRPNSQAQPASSGYLRWQRQYGYADAPADQGADAHRHSARRHKDFPDTFFPASFKFFIVKKPCSRASANCSKFCGSFSIVSSFCYNKTLRMF